MGPDGTTLILLYGILVLIAVGLLGGVFAGGIVFARHRMGRGLGLEEARYRSVVDTAVDPIVTINSRGLIMTFNRAAEQTFGFNSDEAVGKNVSILMPEPYRRNHDSYLRRFLVTGEKKIIGIGREVVGRRRDGSTFPLDLSVGEWRDGEVRYFTGIMRDISERKEAEERFRLLMREVDHRAKNALAAVQAVVRVTRSDDPAVYADMVEGRIAAIARAHTMLAASSWSGADLRELVRGELAPFEGNVVINMAGPPALIRAEAAQAMSMVLHELTTNAVKHGCLSAPGGRLNISWFLVEKDGGLELEWEEVNSKPIATPRPMKEGFGTKLLRSTVEGQLAGRISQDWRKRGLVVRVDLPPDAWQAPSVVRRGPATVSSRPGATRVQGRRILIVEDEALAGLSLKALLEDAGFTVLGPASRIHEALALVEQERPDAALLDVNLYGESVEAVAVALKGQAVPFAFCTGYQDLNNAEYATGAPVLHKPVNGDRLLNVVGGMLEHR